MFLGCTLGLITQRSQVQILTPLPIARPRKVYPYAAFLRSPVFFSSLIFCQEARRSWCISSSGIKVGLLPVQVGPVEYPPIPACSTEIAAVAPPEIARADVAPGWGPLYSHAVSLVTPGIPSIARPGRNGKVTEFVAVALPDFPNSRAVGILRGRISESQLPASKSGVLDKGPLAPTRIPSTIIACGADSLSMGVTRVGPRSTRARSASSPFPAREAETPESIASTGRKQARWEILPQMKKAPAPTEALFCFHNPHPSRKEDYAP